MSDLPPAYRRFREEFPEIAAAYDNLGDAAHSLGALSDKERHLTKLSLAIGARLEGATKAHVRRALEAGLSADEIKQVVALAVTTLGFPAAVSAYTWVNDVLDEQ